MLTIEKTKQLISILLEYHVIDNINDFNRLKKFSLSYIVSKNPSTSFAKQFYEIIGNHSLVSILEDILPDDLKIENYYAERRKLAQIGANDLMENSMKYAIKYYNHLEENKKKVEELKHEKYKELDKLDLDKYKLKEKMKALKKKKKLLKKK
ncbi:MAG: hypothetical protein QXU98_11070 [Candidatus Parvarchaeota archaeon]